MVVMLRLIELAMRSERRLVARSDSLRVTKKLFPFSSTWSRESLTLSTPASSSVSRTSVEEETTRGVPMAMTGMPRV